MEGEAGQSDYSIEAPGEEKALVAPRLGFVWCLWWSL